MKAMILAAGLGTRLRPLTADRPKALVTIAGHTLLDIALRRLRAAGIREVIVNAHHFADQIRAWLDEHGPTLGMRIEVSFEDTLLDTGGGLQHAAWFFREAASGEPFLVHNVDVISTIDLAAIVAAHKQRGALATLAVQQRTTSRYLLFDSNHALCGRRTGADGAPQLVRATAAFEPLAFTGIHVLSPRIFDLMRESGAFSIIDAYLRLAAAGEFIAAFPADGSYWRDLGRLEHLAQAERDLASGLFSIP